MQKIKRFLSIFLLVFSITSCVKQENNLTKIVGEQIAIDSISKSDSRVTDVINPYKQKMVEEINRVISYAPKNLVRTDGDMQSSLGNLLADLCFEKADSLFFLKEKKSADFALFNYGGIRAGINKGKVTNKNVFELMPFDNTLVVVEMTAKKVNELLSYFVKNKKAHPLSKNAQIVLSNKKNLIKINGKKLNNEKTYFVVTSNYLQSGGDNMIFFKNPVSLFDSNYLVRDAIQSYFESKDTLIGKLDNRIIIKK